jgi:hypothetical protein
MEDALHVVFANPKRIKNVPVRKTDMSDSKRLARLLRHGLIRGSIIPPEEQRRWRDLTRTRKTNVQTLGDFKRMWRPGRVTFA